MKEWEKNSWGTSSMTLLVACRRIDRTKYKETNLQKSYVVSDEVKREQVVGAVTKKRTHLKNNFRYVLKKLTVE